MVVLYITSMSLELAISWISRCNSREIFSQNPVFMYGILAGTGFNFRFQQFCSDFSSRLNTAPRDSIFSFIAC